jgi:hypothetical protein
MSALSRSENLRGEKAWLQIICRATGPPVAAVEGRAV